MKWMSSFTHVLVLLALAGPAVAHEGHDHAEEAPALPLAAGAARTSASSDLYELVAVAEGESLRLYLDRWADNSPISKARIEVESGSWKALATPAADGSYLVAAPPLTRPGRHDLLFTISHGDEGDLLQSTLEVSAPVTAATPASHQKYWLLGIVLLMISLLVPFGLWRKRP